MSINIGVSFKNIQVLWSAVLETVCCYYDYVFKKIYNEKQIKWKFVVFLLLFANKWMRKFQTRAVGLHEL